MKRQHKSAVKRENLTFNFEIKSFDDSDPDKFKFEGYASTFGDLDFGYDKILKGAFLDTIKYWAGQRKKLPVLWQHDSDHPLGVFTHLAEDDRGLFFKAELPREDTFVSGRVIPQVKIGSIASMSIGYYADEFSFENDANDFLIRVLKKISLREISLVTFPMNENADITNFKSTSRFQDLPLANSEHKWDSEAADQRVREFLQVKEAPNDKYKQAFLWHEKENKDSFEAYRLPILDVIEGKLHVVPSAVVSAALAVTGAQGSIGIPARELVGIKGDIVKYYKKMDKESPFEEKTCFRVDYFEQLSERELEKLLRKGVSFSNNQAKKLVKLWKTQQCDVVDNSARDAKGFRDLLADIKNI